MRPLIVCLILFCTAPLQAKEPPKVLASIKPLQLIAAAITDGVSTPAVLLPPGASPHSYQLRPSERLQLAQTTLLLWVGPDLEPHLSALHQEAEHAISVQAQPQLIKAANDEQQHDHGSDGHHHHEALSDPHLWLAPGNARLIARALSLKLQQLDPTNKARYSDNLIRFNQRLDTLEQQVNIRYPALQQHGFYVFHDAWGYLADAFDLNVLGHITLSPELQPGARHLVELHEQFEQQAPLCLFLEPNFRPAYLERIRAELPVYLGEIDPMASQQTVHAEGYSEFLDDTLSRIDHCLKQLE